MNEVREPEFYEWEDLPDREIEQTRKDEIADAPSVPNELREEIIENYPEASPADSGGDIDAEWQEVETTGSENVFGHNPTPDQSNVEANAHAMGVNFEDKEPLNFTEKMEKRDEDRQKLEP
ncbi:MAG: DUF6335 family protein [Pyrinomonadaceae bacterium]